MKPKLFKSVGEAFRMMRSISENFYSDFKLINLEYQPRVDTDGTFKAYFGNGFENHRDEDNLFENYEAIMQEYRMAERDGMESMKNEMERKERSKRYLDRTTAK